MAIYWCLTRWLSQLCMLWRPGLLEIKCPYSHKGESVINAAAANDSNFSLEMSDDLVHLTQKHAYYYQVQTQLFVLNMEYCDFCVCTFTGDEEGLFVEHIVKNVMFWDECVLKAEHFFHTGILPELLGRWYTRPRRTKETRDSQHDPSCSTSNQTDSRVHCYCSHPDEGEMIACDNENCVIEWFYMKSLKLKSVPKGDQYNIICQTSNKCNVPDTYNFIFVQ